MGGRRKIPEKRQRSHLLIVFEASHLRKDLCRVEIDSPDPTHENQIATRWRIVYI